MYHDFSFFLCKQNIIYYLLLLIKIIFILSTIEKYTQYISEFRIISIKHSGGYPHFTSNYLVWMGLKCTKNL